MSALTTIHYVRPRTLESSRVRPSIHEVPSRPSRVAESGPTGSPQDRTTGALHSTVQPLSVSGSEIDVVRLVDEVGFSGAQVAEFGGELIEGAANVRDVEIVGLGFLECHAQGVHRIGQVAVLISEPDDPVPEPRLGALDVVEETVPIGPFDRERDFELERRGTQRVEPCFFAARSARLVVSCSDSSPLVWTNTTDDSRSMSTPKASRYAS
jgi:hypothetical protein